MRYSEYDFLLKFYSNYGSISCCFWDIQCRKMLWPWNQFQRSLKVMKVVPFNRLYGFLLVFYSNFVPKMHCFWDIRLVSIQWAWNQSSKGSLNVIRNDTIQSGTYDLLLTFHSNHRPISHRFRRCEIDDNLHQKLQIIPTPCIYSPLWRGYPWNLVSAQGSEETKMVGLPDGRKSLKDRFSHFDTMLVCDRHPASQAATLS